MPSLKDNFSWEQDRPFQSLTNDLILVGCNHGGLIGRIGSAQMICILNGKTVTATESGMLYLRINDPVISDDSGAITVRITSG